MVGSHIHKSGVAPDIVDAVWKRAGNVLSGKIVTLNMGRFSARSPLPAGVVVVADQFLLLGVDRDHRDAQSQASLDLEIDVPELRITVRVIVSLLGLALAVALQTVVQIMKDNEGS